MGRRTVETMPSCCLELVGRRPWGGSRRRRGRTRACAGQACSPGRGSRSPAARSPGLILSEAGQMARSSIVVALEPEDARAVGPEGARARSRRWSGRLRPGSRPRRNCGAEVQDALQLCLWPTRERLSACSSAASRRVTCRRRWRPISPVATAAPHQTTAETSALAVRRAGAEVGQQQERGEHSHQSGGQAHQDARRAPRPRPR